MWEADALHLHVAQPPPACPELVRTWRRLVDHRLTLPATERNKVGFTSKKANADYSDDSSDDDEKSFQPHPTKKRSRKRKLTSCTASRHDPSLYDRS